MRINIRQTAIADTKKKAENQAWRKMLEAAHGNTVHNVAIRSRPTLNKKFKATASGYVEISRGQTRR